MNLTVVGKGDAEPPDTWYEEMSRLQGVMQKAALDLFAHTGGAGFMIPVPNTTPTLYIASGPVESLQLLLDSLKQNAEIRAAMGDHNDNS